MASRANELFTTGRPSNPTHFMTSPSLQRSHNETHPHTDPRKDSITSGSSGVDKGGGRGSGEAMSREQGSGRCLSLPRRAEE